MKMRFSDRSIVWTAPTGVAPYGLRIVNNKVYDELGGTCSHGQQPGNGGDALG
jgi:hypothetical protein